MNCTEARARWHLRFDEGRADPELDAHVDRCDECRVYDAQMRNVMRTLGELRTFTEGLLAPASPPAFRMPSRRRFRQGWAMAACIALLAVGYGHWTRTGVKEAPSRVAATEPSRIGLSLRGESATHLMAVAAPNDDPQVQVYWLYSRPEPSPLGEHSKDDPAIEPG